MKNLVNALRHPRAYRWWALRPWRLHSLVLTVGGLIYLGIATAYITAAPPIVLAERLAPMPCWGAMFGLGGLCALASSRWPPASEKWGYSVLSSIAALWAAFYFLGWLFFDGAHLSGGLVWSLVTILWIAISGLDNPRERVIDDRRP